MALCKAFVIFFDIAWIVSSGGRSPISVKMTAIVELASYQPKMSVSRTVLDMAERIRQVVGSSGLRRKHAALYSIRMKGRADRSLLLRSIDNARKKAFWARKSLSDRFD